ncbi:hypothetical protein NP493_1271g01048 [Ridgeia piscesae]|uniref:Uncharacterized protein n=1 Tax=Ridgeia piscesae TaxID=27915 RepID=A0AAD9NHN3_RIDPI|nr:hypothetical protein NP493_1271g01048 [Ridgeia piscesae]
MESNSGFAKLIFLGAILVAVADDNEYNLVRDIMRNYDYRIIPTRNSTEALNVSFSVALSQIIDVDEKNQIVTTNCWLTQTWVDFNLKWSPVKYGGIEVVRLPHDSIWKPDILLYNNADVSSYKSTINTKVIVSSNGVVKLLSMAIFHSSCDINVKYFPFDEQRCTLKFSSWTYDMMQLNLLKLGEEGDLSNYVPNTEWALVKLHVVRNTTLYSCCDEPYPDVTYTIQIRRKPLFHVFNMIFPCFLITLVALLGFCVPSDSGEKVTMGITTLLSMTVFLMFVTESLPVTSDVLPIICLFFGITMAIVSLATAMAVMTLNIHSKGHRGAEVPGIVRKVCFRVLARMLCIKVGTLKVNTAEKVFIPASDTNSDDVDKDTFHNNLPENGGLPPTSRFSMRLGLAGTSSGDGAVSDNFEQQFLRVLNRINQTIEMNEIRLAEEDRRDVIKYEWQQVALVVDRVLFFVFVITTVGLTYGILIHAPNSWRYILG